MALTTTAIHRITTVHGPAKTTTRSVAACPRRREGVDLEECLGCPFLRSFAEGAGGEPHLLCVSEKEEGVASAPGTVGSVMSRDVICVRPEVSVESVEAILRQRNIGGMPVVDDDGHPLGIVSKTDILRVLGEGRLREELDTFDEEAPPRPVYVAREVMTPTALTLRESDTVTDAAERLTRARIHRAPVLSSDGRVVGIVTSLDLMTALAARPLELD